MMTPQDVKFQKKMSAIAKLNLSQERLDAIEAYLKDEASLETLERFPVQNLTNFRDYSEIAKQIQGDLNKGRTAEAEKLFNVLFSIGGVTCASAISIYGLQAEKLSGVETAKRLAVCAENVQISWGLYRNGIQELLKMTTPGKRPETILQAIEYGRQINAPGHTDGRLILLAMYFLVKYPSTGADMSGQEDSKGILSGISRLFPKKELSMPQEDKRLLEQYQGIILNRFPELISNPNPQTVQEITEALRENRVDDRILQSAEGCRLKNSSLLSILGGTAFLNYTLSPILKNTVRLLLAVDSQQTLRCMEHVKPCLSAGRIVAGNVDVDYEKVFGLDPKKLLAWAVPTKNRSVMQEQLNRNPEIFLQVMEEMNFDNSNTMLQIIREKKPVLYQKIIKSRQSDGDNQEREKLIDSIVPKGNTPEHALLKDFLRGKEPVTAIYPLADLMGYKYSGSSPEQLHTYGSRYKDDSFIRRVLTYKAVQGSDYFLMNYYKVITAENVKYLYDSFDTSGADLLHQANFAAMLYDSSYPETRKEQFFRFTVPVFQTYLSERKEETVRAFQDANAGGRYLGLLVYEKNAGEYKEQILQFTRDSSKLVREKLLEILYLQPDWAEDIKPLLDSKKGVDREIAVQVLARWDNGQGIYTEILTQALEKEKSAKVKSLLEAALKLEGKEAAAAAELSLDDMVKEIHKGGRKRGLAWAYENRAPFSTVHKRDGSEASEDYLQAIWLCYSSMNQCGVNATAKTLAGELNEGEFALCANELFDRWMEDGAESKKRWVLYAAAIHGGTDIIEKLKHQINEWPQNARGAIAAEAVKALALNPLPQALLTVDGISRKFKFKQVKEAAGKALEYAASQLGLTTEELADKIVPDLGFDENMERHFDYGERKFTVTITPALEIEIFDESGKKIKNMPAPGKKDDEEKAKAASEEFKQLKKQMKATVSSQKMRLELALSAERQWSADAWKDLFVKNPVMHQFAIGLIWGVYEEGKLIQSFRYMEDGSFNTEEEEEFAFPQQGRIGLVHPIELTKESVDAWKQQLEDYEITQPIEQLGREIFYITEEEKKSKRMERYGGYIMNALSLGGKLQAMGWYRGSVQDAGGFYTYYREDESVGLGAELHFSGTYVGAGYEDEVTVYDVRFYYAGAIARGSYRYDEADEKNSIALGRIPARYFSETVLQLKKATASSQERDENWKKQEMYR